MNRPRTKQRHSKVQKTQMTDTHDKDGLEVLPFSTAAEWREWLTGNSETSPGIWLKIAKKKSGIQSVTYVEALDDAL